MVQALNYEKSKIEIFEKAGTITKAEDLL